LAKRSVLLFSLIFFLIMGITELFSTFHKIIPGKKQIEVTHSKDVTTSKRDLTKFHKGLGSPQPKTRYASVQALASTGDESSIPFLIDALADDTVFYGNGIYENPGMYTVRYWANEALVKITGQDFHFKWDDSPPARDGIVLRWRNWARGHSASSSAVK